MMDDSDKGSVFESSFWWGTKIPRRSDPDLHASSSSTSNTIYSDLTCNPNPKICRLNDSIYELHRPAGTPSMQVLFFHGLQFQDSTDPHISTWKSRDGSQLWPQTWLVDEFPGAHVLSVSYGASVVQETLDLYCIAENLTADLLIVNIGQDPRCPVVLVGHCFGGLVIKRLCVHMQERKLADKKAASSFRRAKLVNFLENVKGIFYYSTPHHGISSEIAKHFAKGPLLEFVEVLSTQAERLNNEFNALRHGCYQNAWRIAGVGENLPMKLNWRRSVLVVPEPSAREGEIFNVVQGADHISVCKPDGKTSRSFNALTQHLQHIVDHSKVNLPVHEVQGLPDLDYHVQLEEGVREIEQKLETTPVLGVVGMGGVGKTTLVKALFNSISKEFEYTCFVDIVKGIPQHALKDSVLSQFYRNGSRVDGPKTEWSHFKDKKMLLVMDDIDMEEQVTFLPKLHSFGKGSRVIITTRDQSLLKVFDHHVCHEVEFLEEDAAKQLFCKHAFRQEEIPSSFTERHLIRGVVEKCGGLPLTLEVMGRYLRGHEDDAEFWKETIGRLGEAQPIDGRKNDRVWAVLRVSYDALINQEQEMFRSAATYFFGKPLERALAAWSTTCGKSKIGWKNLVSKFLVKEVCQRRYDYILDIEIEGKVIWVHEHLRDLASKILSPNNRMDADDDDSAAKLVERLKFKQVSEDRETEFLDLRYPRWDIRSQNTTPTLLCESLLNMKQLKYVTLRGDLLEGSPKKFPRNLSLLSWDGGTVWTGDSRLEFPVSYIEEMENLTILELAHWQTSQAFLVALGKLSNLCILSLKWMTGVDLLPKSFGSLLSLKILHFSGVELSKLPESFDSLSGLEQLYFHFVPLLELPMSFGSLSKLEQLNFEYVPLLELPESFGKLSSLKQLLFRNVKLSTLPKSFGELSSLKQLLFRNVKLSTLPKSFGKLCSLVVLRIEDYCINLENSLVNSLAILPENFGLLLSLEELVLGSKGGILDPRGNPKRGILESLPDSFGQLKALKKLTIYQEKLQSLPDSFCHLKSLQELRIDAEGLEMLPNNLGAFKSLQKLILDVRNEKALPESVGQLSSLRELSLTSNSAEKWSMSPSHFRDLGSLEQLRIMAKGLETLPENLGQLKSLQYLTLDVPNVKALPESVGQLSSLIGLRFTSKSAEKLPESLRACFPEGTDSGSSKCEGSPGGLGAALFPEGTDSGSSKCEGSPGGLGAALISMRVQSYEGKK